MAATRKSLVAQTQPRRRLNRIRRGLLTLILLAPALVIAVVIYQNNWRGSAAERGTEALVKAFSKSRVIEPRLSGGFKAAAYNAEASDVKAEKIEEARRLIEPQAGTGADPLVQLAWGRLLILDNKDRPALTALRLAVERLSHSAEAHNDLGVCYYQRGKYEEAIKAFEAALNINPKMCEALFNRALCYNRLQLRMAAQAEWDRLAGIETDSGWLNEVNEWRDKLSRQLQVDMSEPEKERRKRIEKQLIDEVSKNNIDAARAIVYENIEVASNVRKTLVLLYLDARINGRGEEAETTLSTMRKIADLLKEKGDWMLSDVADYAANLAGNEWATEQVLIQDFFNNCLAIGGVDDRAQKAYERMKELNALFRDRKNYVFQARASHEIADYLLTVGRYEDCLTASEEALAVIAKHKWPLELGWIYGHLSRLYIKHGIYSLAIKYAEQSIEVYKGLNAKDCEAKAVQAMAHAYSYIGDIDNALAKLRQSLDSTIATVPRAAEVTYGLLEMADFYRIRGNPRLTMLYAEEAYKVAEQAMTANPSPQSLSFLLRYMPQTLSLMAVELAQLNRTDEAEENLKLSFEHLNKLRDNERTLSQQHVLSRAAEIAVKVGDNQRALKYYSDAEALLSNSQESSIWLIKVLNDRAGVYAKMKETAKARADLDRAMSLIEQYRAKIDSSKDRSQFLATSQSVFDRLISLDVSVDHWVEAFGASEKSRARSLRDEMSLEHAGLKDLQAELPDKTTVLQYAVTDHGTYIFAVSRAGFETAISPATTKQLDHLVSDYMSDLKDKVSRDQLDIKAKELYQYLIAPIEGRLAPDTRLCIVPDKGLHFLPFAALVDGGGRYLLQNFRYTSAPSSTVLINCIREDRKKSGRGLERFFAAGNPDFDRDEFKNLPELTDAVTEVRDSATFYSNPVVRVGAEATEKEVREQIKNCEVAHLALHCLVNESESWLAALVLARDQQANSAYNLSQANSSDGKLYYNEVYGLSLPHMRLAILSACQSGIGQYYRGEGIVSIVRPFIAAKVPMVVASLWPVDSKVTSELMVEFHKQRKALNKPTGDALRAAQLQLVEENRHPYFWAPFIAIGSNN